ncbi:MAG: hypothetical protein OEY49_20285, partial [Candidatus Heimdallarchaeota archaeon]|nr:hypothetical protein [Candidatus Heimdallarchaeota archaeon]
YSAMNGIMLHHENEKIENYLVTATQIFDELEDDYLTGTIEGIYGDYFRKNKNYNYALECYTESSQLMKICQRKNSYYEINLKIASLNMALFNYNTTIELYKQVLWSSNQYNIIHAYLGLSSIYAKMDMNTNAYKYLRLAGEFASQSDNPYLITLVNDHLGYYYGKMEFYESAISLFKRNISFKSDLEISSKITQFKLAWVYYKQNDFFKAMDLVMYAMNKFDEDKEQAYLIQGSLLLDNINLMMENPDDLNRKKLNFIIDIKQLDLDIPGSSIRISPEEISEVLPNMLIPVDNIIILSEVLSMEIRQLLINGFNLTDNEDVIDEIFSKVDQTQSKNKTLFIANIKNQHETKCMKVILYKNVSNIEDVLKIEIEKDYCMPIKGNQAMINVYQHDKFNDSIFSSPIDSKRINFSNWKQV